MVPYPLFPLPPILTFILLSILFSLPPPSSASASATCSELYGHPLQQSCRQLLHGPNGIPSSANSRLFSLPFRHRPPHILTTQWRTRQRLPFLSSNGVCNIALLAIQLLDGTTTFDTTTWADVVASGELVLNKCVDSRETEGGTHTPSGGHVIAGDHGRLALLLYASGSVYDLQVQDDLSKGRTVVAEQDPGNGIGEKLTANHTVPKSSRQPPRSHSSTS